MTKFVRIENADCSDHKVVVYAEVKNDKGEWVRETANTTLDHPTQLMTGMIYKQRRLVVEELD